MVYLGRVRHCPATHRPGGEVHRRDAGFVDRRQHYNDHQPRWRRWRSGWGGPFRSGLAELSGHGAQLLRQVQNHPGDTTPRTPALPVVAGQDALYPIISCLIIVCLLFAFPSLRQRLFLGRHIFVLITVKMKLSQRIISINFISLQRLKRNFQQVVVLCMLSALLE